jgi:hypothetical protein
MKLQALISWQVSKNQLQQENEKRRETNFDKKKGKKKTLNRKGNGQSTSSPCSSHFILLPTTPPTYYTCLLELGAKRKRNRTGSRRSSNKEAPQNTNPKNYPISFSFWNMLTFIYLFTFVFILPL